jgi:hypothetical protein
MNPNLSFGIFRFSTLTIGAAFFIAPLAMPSLRQNQEQQSSPSQPQAASPQSPQPQQPTLKPKKVWGNEDVVLLRTPADEYQAEKEAHAVAEVQTAAKEAAQAKLIKEAGLTIKLPATAEETQRIIKTKEGEISEEQSGIERMNSELPATPADQKAAVQKEIDRVTTELGRDRVELEVLRNHLEKLNKMPANPPSPVLPSPPSI